MKTKEFIDQLLKLSMFPGDTNSGSTKYALHSEHIKLFEKTLLDCDEFKEVSELILVDLPIFKDADGRVTVTATAKLNPETKLRGRVYLYEIFLVPGDYKEQFIDKPIKTGAILTPTLYDPEDYTPYRNIVIPFREHEGKEESREAIHRLVNQIIDNPSEFLPKVEPQVMIRGSFEIIE
jgi:hypothetical protein